MKHVVSFKMLRRTNSKLPLLLFIDTFVDVDSLGADCAKLKHSVYGRFLSRAPSALNIYAYINYSIYKNARVSNHRLRWFQY